MSHLHVFVLLKRDFGEYNEKVVAALMQPYFYENLTEPYPDACYCSRYPDCDDCKQKDSYGRWDPPCYHCNYYGQEEDECHHADGREKCEKVASGWGWHVSYPIWKWDYYDIIGKLPEGKLEDYPGAIIDVNGMWHEQGDDEAEPWEAFVDDSLAQHKSIVIEVDCHG